MDNRFSFKDFLFLIAFLLVLVAVGFSIYQSNYHETRLNAVKEQLQNLTSEQRQQTSLLSDIRNSLQRGVQVSSAATQREATGRIRRQNPDGSLYVYYPEPPRTPRDPESQPDYARGDWLVQNIDTEPKVIAPFIERDYSGALVHEPVLETLVAINPETFEYEPYLAESYEISADGLRFRFRLRPGVCFSDGHPMTAADVLFSFNTLMNTDVDAAPLRSYFTRVKECRKIDDRTVEFTMSEPYFQAMGFIGAGLMIIPEHIYKFEKGADYNNRGDVLVASGPYRLERWDRGQQIVMVRNEHYWGERPTFDRLIFKFITNPQAAFQAFQSSQIDWFNPDPEQFLKFSQDPEFLKSFIAFKYQRPGSGYSFIGYNEERPMFKDKLTRQALTMLIDRQAVIDTLLRGIGTLTSGHFSPVTPQNDPSIKPWPYDPAAARKRLEEAGWKPGPDGVLVRDGGRFEFALSMGANNPVGERMANYVKEQFARAGIRMSITPSEFAILNMNLDERKFDAVMMSWASAAETESDPYQIWHSDSIANRGSNFISFRNAESDRLIDEARRTLDTDKRMALWHQWQALIHQEQPYTFLLARQERIFINGRFRNTQAYKLSIIPYDWYVPAASQKYH